MEPQKLSQIKRFSFFSSLFAKNGNFIPKKSLYFRSMLVAVICQCSNNKTTNKFSENNFWRNENKTFPSSSCYAFTRPWLKEESPNILSSYLLGDMVCSLGANNNNNNNFFFNFYLKISPSKNPWCHGSGIGSLPDPDEVPGSYRVVARRHTCCFCLRHSPLAPSVMS